MSNTPTTVSSGSLSNWFTLPDALDAAWLIPYAATAHPAQAVNIGDMCYDAGGSGVSGGGGVAYSAAQQASQSSEAADQVLFAKWFIGCATEACLSTETNTTRQLNIRSQGVKAFNCPSQTWKIGDLVGIYSDGSHSPDPQQVDAANSNPQGAIGFVVAPQGNPTYYASAVTVVYVFFCARHAGSDFGAVISQAATGGGGGAPKNVNLTTVGNGTITAASMVNGTGGVVTRSGPTSAFTDTTATAAAIITAAPPGTTVNSAWYLTIKNTTAFAETLAGGTNVTLSGQTIIPPNSVGRFLITETSATAVSMQGIEVVPLTTNPLPVVTNLNTVGAGTITAAGIAGGITARGGAQSSTAFTDTTDTATNLQAALPNANVGQAMTYIYQNNTNAPATITGGTGVTVSGVTVVPAGEWAEFLVTLTAAATFTMVGIATGQNTALPPAKFTTIATDTTIAGSAGDITGADFVVYRTTAAGAGGIAYTTRTGAQLFADIPNAQIGFSYMLMVVSQGGGTVTISAGDGNVTLVGTMTIATKTTRLFVVTITAANALTIQSVSKGTIE